MWARTCFQHSLFKDALEPLTEQSNEKVIGCSNSLLLLLSVTGSVIAENTRQRLTNNLNLPPEAIDFDLSDLIDADQKQRDQKQRDGWTAYQDKMATAYADTQAFVDSGSDPAAGIEAWERFLKAFDADNPFGNEDNSMRTRAKDAMLGLEEVERTLQAEWSDYQGKMTKAYEEVLEFLGATQDPKLQVQSVNRFLETFSADNHFSEEDESMRSDARDGLTNLESIVSILNTEEATRQSLQNTALMPWLTQGQGQTQIDNSKPKQKIELYSLRVGVYYSDEFRSFIHGEVIRDSGRFKVDLSKQSLDVFRSLTKSLFTEVSEIQQPILTNEEKLNLDGVLVSSEEMKSLDGVFIPTIKDYGFLIPSISGLTFYSASIEYRLTMYDKLGTKIGDWNIVGYGESEARRFSRFSRKKSVNKATALAIRDAGARIADELMVQPSVQDWLRSITVNADSPAGSKDGVQPRPDKIAINL